MSHKDIRIVFGGLFLGMFVACGQAELPGTDEGLLDTIQQSLDSALVPTMSNNTSPSGIVTRSGVYSSSYEAWQAFDGTTATLWLSNMYTSSVWIGYEWGGGISNIVNSYQINYANGSCCEQRGPKNWTLQGWNGSTWVTVDTVTNQTGWYLNFSRTYTVAAPGAYSKYRLNVTADNYNDPTYPITLVSIASLQLYGTGAPCGSVGEACCSGSCFTGVCGDNLCVSSCGNLYEQCCGGFDCDFGYTCSGGYCQLSCGGFFESCCYGFDCDFPYSCMYGTCH